jgi:hypothetical protein
MNKLYCPIIIALACMLTQPASAELKVTKSGLCNSNKVIIQTKENWYAAGIYVDGVRLSAGDKLANEDISFNTENRLQLAANKGSGNYLITTVEETEHEAEASVCN